MASRGTRATRVMQYMSEHAGKVLYLDKMSRALDLDPGSLRVAINNIRRDKADVFPIEIIVRGSAWKHTPIVVQNGNPHAIDAITEQVDQGADAGPTRYVEIGRAQNGDPVVEGPDGILYRVIVI